MQLKNDEYYPEDIETNNNYKHYNRIKKLSPKTGKFWCGGCDGVLVGEGEKCYFCGTRNIKNRHIRNKK